MLNIVVILALVLLAGLFIFFAIRSLRARRAWIKWPGVLVSGLFGLLFTAVSALAVVGLYKLNVSPYTHSAADVQVAGTPEQVARGERLAYICIDCHSSTGELPLDGSLDNLTAAAPSLGVLYASNLTPGGPLKDWTDGEILRAIREGVNNDGRPMLFMTSEPFHNFSDEDAQALVAYLRAQPAVARDLPERNLNVMAAVFVGTGLAPTSAQPPITAPVAAPPAGTAEYGKYLVDTSGCRDCHGPDLTGPTNPFVPPGPNLTVRMPGYGEEQFLAFIHTGVNASGRDVDQIDMPWKSYSRAFSDDELRDIYSYLRALPAAENAK